jgi:hypothetical protein
MVTDDQTEGADIALQDEGGGERELAPHELRALQVIERAEATVAASKARPYAGAADDWERDFHARLAQQRPQERIVQKRAPIDPPPCPAPPVAYLSKTDAEKYQSALEVAIGAALKRQREVIEAAWRERVVALETRLAAMEGRLAAAENPKGRRK